MQGEPRQEQELTGGSCLPSLSDRIGIYQMHRIEWLAGHSIPMNVISELTNVPLADVEQLLYGPEEEIEREY